MKPVIIFFTAILLVILSCSTRDNKQGYTGDLLFDGFVDPPAEARPFVRWWWNGNHITAGEIIRQLDVLKDAGIGGVEINPIAMPEEANDIGTVPLVWLSREWNDLLVLAAKEAQQKGMITDLIVGSGWPFGGEFVTEEEAIQRIMSHRIAFSGGDIIGEDTENLMDRFRASLDGRILRFHAATSYEILFARLVPVDTGNVSEIIDLTWQLKENGRIDFRVPAGDYELVYGVLERSVREVMHGAPGAAGTVMNHYDSDITRAYLNRLKKISEDTGIPLNRLIRALFCDSIELAGSNWTGGFEKIFYRAYGYSLEPYLPFIFYHPYDGYRADSYSDRFMNEIRRVRYDYNKLLVDMFNDNFTRVFHEFCSENGLLSRYQAYGTPFLMGLMEGNMIPDIPESNNWIYSAGMDGDRWEWNQGHGYMIWNLYAASGGHLKGRQIISNESMTNTRGVFKTSLEEIKQHDDMNFITGMNHSVLHGYNYSPPEAGFPGWIRYGSYFSEQNTWWPYFSRWVDYNARLSHVFQQTEPVKNIAILGPVGDIWAEKGLTRVPFHMEPWYCYRLWEPISQAGSSCDYISEEIIREGSIQAGRLNYGPMSYQAIFLAGVRSLEPETAIALLEFASSGGKLVIIDNVPSRSLSFNDPETGDRTVTDAFARMLGDYQKSVIMVSSPGSDDDLLTWTVNVLEKIAIERDIGIADADGNVFQIRKKLGERDIFFFTNIHRRETSVFQAVFPTGDKIPWIWNPEEGTRSVFPFGRNRNELAIVLQPLESLLLVFEPDLDGNPSGESHGIKTGRPMAIVKGPWNVRFEHMNGMNFERGFERLFDFGTSDDEELNTFAGTVSYYTTFNYNGRGSWLRLGEVNKGVTEVWLNGKKAGLNWYGRPNFPVEDLLVEGENSLEIRYTTVLSNYVMSLTDNPTAERWTAGYEKIPVGIEGDVVIYGK